MIDGKKPRRLRVLGEGEHVFGPPPAHLDDLAAGFWIEAASQLEALGIGVPTDSFDLEYASILYSKARRAESEMEQVGCWYRDMTTAAPRRHPLELMSAQARRELRLVTESLGLSAIGRVRRGLVTPPAETDDRPNPYEKPARTS